MLRNNNWFLVGNSSVDKPEKYVIQNSDIDLYYVIKLNIQSGIMA